MRDQRERLSVADQLRKSLEEGIQHLRGEITLRTTVVELPDPPPGIGPVGLSRLREGRKMSQAVFAQLLNVSAKTVQSWEQGTRRPSQAALRLIQVFREDPERLMRIAGMTAGSEKAKPKTGKRRQSV